jgi:uncharacterized damage-inducible protein DinB
MSPLLQEMFAHQEWADAEHWRAIAALPAARDHAAMRKRLHHIHQVQRAFVWGVGERAAVPNRTTVDDYPTFDGLMAYARTAHEEVRQMLAGMTDTRLAEQVSMPWFPSTFPLTVESALAQMVMHSHYHRGQNATLLRELGGEPPLTDLIFWCYKGRPAPDWGLVNA